MSPISINIKQAASPSASPWRKVGLTESPFPASGVATHVDYDAHQVEQIERVNEWLAETVAANAKAWAPLAISGSIGVGKTHVLRRMERALRGFRDVDSPGSLMVSYLPLTGSGMKMQLSNLLFEVVSQPLPGETMPLTPTEIPLLSATLRAARRRRGHWELSKILPQPSPISKPLEKILAAQSEAEAAVSTSLMASWLMRRNLSRTEQERLGIAGRLEGEGQAVRAFAHLCIFARSTGVLRTWVLLVDQMEDLWRRDLTTALRRTRFLTDLRTLVDEALEGAPVALTLAWNTEVVVGGSRVEEDVENKLKQDYIALFSRVRNVVRIPLLPLEHALQFATAYIDHAYKHAAIDGRDSEQDRSKLVGRLNRDFQAILSRVSPYGRRQGGGLVARAWLEALRLWADDVVA